MRHGRCEAIAAYSAVNVIAFTVCVTFLRRVGLAVLLVLLIVNASFWWLRKSALQRYRDEFGTNAEAHFAKIYAKFAEAGSSLNG